jgi:hypothetical protein
MSESGHLNLLFGILALQLRFVTRDQLREAVEEWTREKDMSIGQILKRLGALSRDELLLMALLTNYGGYAGYTRQWNRDIESNIGYGYVQTDGIAFMPGASARTAQNAWANVIHSVNDIFFVGLEYH